MSVRFGAVGLCVVMLGTVMLGVVILGTVTCVVRMGALVTAASSAYIFGDASGLEPNWLDMLSEFTAVELLVVMLGMSNASEDAKKITVQ